MMVGHLVEALLGKKRLLPGQMLANRSGAGERFGGNEAVMEAPEKV